jgi:hypothetical protein
VTRPWRSTLVQIEDDERVFHAYDVGTRWNGFVDYAVTEETWTAMKARFLAWIRLAPGEDLEEATRGLDEMMVEDGFVHLGGGAFVILSEIGMRDVEYGRWKIHFEPPPIPIRRHDWSFWHDDYDGPGDPRCGTAESLEAARRAVDEHEEESR